VFISSFLSLIAMCLSILSTLHVSRFEQQQAIHGHRLWLQQRTPPQQWQQDNARAPPSTSSTVAREVSAYSSTSASAMTQILQRDIDGDDGSHDQLDASRDDDSKTRGQQ
jgi:hypothetical protein